MVAAAIIHLLPVTGVLGGEHLARLYGTMPGDPVTVVLLRHRAVLFAIVGGLLVAGAVLPGVRDAALLAGLVSAVSFLLLARPASDLGPAMRRVVIADVVAVGALVVAGMASIADAA